MKFSLKHLLAITLFAVLVINAVNNFQTAKQVRLECEQLQQDIDLQKKATRLFYKKKLLYTRAFEAFEKRRTKLSNADEFFEPVASRHRKIEARDSDQIHIFSGPRDGKPAIDIHETFRVCVPKSPAFELCIGFHETVSSRTVSGPMRDSYYFSPKSQFKFPMNPGDSLIEISLAFPHDGKDTLVVKVDGIAVHTASRGSVLSLQERVLKLAPNSWPKLFTTHRSSSIHSWESAPLALTTVNLWPTKDEPESFSLMLQRVDRGEDRD